MAAAKGMSGSVTVVEAPAALVAPLPVLARIAAALEAHPVLLGLVCVLPLVAKGLFSVSGKLPWFDELFTLSIARLSTVDAWHALLQGADNQPPLMYCLPRLSLMFWSESGLGLRIWSIAGTTALLTSVYLLVGRKLGWVYGALAVVVARLSEVEAFTWEGGRQYALLTGMVAVAALGWFSAGRGAGRARPAWPLVAMGIGLGLAAGVHYFAVLAWAPFAAGQAVRDWETRRIDLPVWVTLALASIPWAVQIVPMYSAIHQFSAHFWEPPSVSKIVFEMYRLLDQVVLFLAPFFFVWLAWHRRGASAPTNPLGRAELVFAAVLASAPLWGFAVLSQAGAFSYRYVMFAVVGWAIVLPVLFRLAEGGVPGLTALAVLLILPVLLALSVRAAWRQPAQPPVVADLEKMRNFEPGSPVLMTEPMRFVEAGYHAPEDLRRRLYHPTDRDRSIRHAGRDTGALSVQGIAPLLKLNSTTYDSFLKDRKEVLIWQSKKAEFKTWIPATMLKEGWSIQWRTEWSQTEILLARRSAP